MSSIRYRLGLLVMACVALGACSRPPERASQKFTGRLIFLSGANASSRDLVELTPSPDGSTYNLKTIESGLAEAAASPDQNKILCATKDDIQLRELSTGAAKSIIKGESFCPQWAPDGNHFSYQQRAAGTTKFYVSDLDGQTKLILEDPNGSTDCPHWIARDRLVIDRFVGARTNKGAEQLKPNTSIVVTLGEPVKLKDTPKKWSIESLCLKSNNGFVRSDQGRLLIAKNIDNFESIDPSPASCTECRFVGYASQSCTPFFVEQPSNTTTELFYLNPMDWQKQKPASIGWTFSPNARFVIKSSARLAIVGDAPDKLLLIDAESGDVTPFFPNKASPPIIVSPAPIVWIEK
ncbi:MAG TPA: hypothetical protein VN696_05240 [Pyrinomonadaceae bacterium]|nr:hypothetical protein [Pyrinomonadaceae bacterium]